MNKEVIKARKQNMKIYSLYRAISLDLIFFYAIEFLFLTQVKHISSSNILLSISLYSIFMIILQIPASIIVDKFGTRKCTIIANIFNSMFLILIIFCRGLKMLIIAQFVSALCYSLKNIADSALIKYSIPKTKKDGEIFSRLEGRAYKNYYLLDASTSVLSGFLYVINPYIPIILSLCFSILSVVMSLGFKDIEEVRNREKNVQKNEIEKYFNDLIKGIKFIINSQRLRSLFLYSGIAWGTFCLIGTYRPSFLVDIGTSEPVITTIAAILGIASSAGSKKQIQFHNYFRNKSLSAILLLSTFSIIIIGVTGIISNSYKITLIIATICFIIIAFSEGVNRVLSTRYLGDFLSEKIVTQIYAINAISQNSFKAIIGLLGAYLLKITNTANSMFLTGIILLITTIGLINYMKNRLGLKPEQYDKKEIYDK